jgi:hypothetical protein
MTHYNCLSFDRKAIAARDLRRTIASAGLATPAASTITTRQHAGVDRYDGAP